MVFQRKALWVSLAAASLLVACGGGGADTSPVAPIKTVKVMGDSIADSGTFGFKFTVQGSAPTGPASTPIFTSPVAACTSMSAIRRPRSQVHRQRVQQRRAGAPTTPLRRRTHNYADLRRLFHQLAS